MPEENLAGQVEISRKPLQKISRGYLKCEIGLMFEVDNLVEVKLFGEMNGV